MAIRAVCFDVGETLVDETRQWAGWADWLGIPHFTFFAALGAVIDRGEPHRRVFELFRPGIDLRAEWERRVAAGAAFGYSRDDLYPDVIPCLEALARAGYQVVAAGNQPARASAWLEALGMPFDLIALPESLGAAKPARAFFTGLAARLGLPPGEIAYVGDRVDNDVVPAADAGMVAIFLRRGPWGYLQAPRPGAARARLRIDDLATLPAALRTLETSAS
ncbi:MAG TPA: HAD family hydrolase [Thermomicrobiaceae bacterium]|nr:HAD family hydrolase [Thermomicrobiaceae bacterium]